MRRSATDTLMVYALQCGWILAAKRWVGKGVADMVQAPRVTCIENIGLGMGARY